MTQVPDPLDAVEAQLADRENKLKARRGKHEYRDSVPMLEAEIERLKGVRDMIRETRMASEDSEPER